MTAAQGHSTPSGQPGSQPGAAPGAGGVPGPPGSSHPRAERITRPGSGRVFAGVCAGTAEHLGLPVKWVRWVFVITALLGGAGLAAYGLLWAFTPVETRIDPSTEHEQERARRSSALRLVVLGVLVILIAALLIFAPVSGMTASELTLAGGAMAVAAGLYLAWTYLDHVDLLRSRGGVERGNGAKDNRLRSASLWLIPLLGAALVVAGVFVLIASSQGVTFTWNLVLATVAVLLGIGIVLMPWGVRVWRRFVAEQETRIRETERADIAAHLHDSVLQTLALIQRTDDVTRVKVLARAQERELRRWLYGGADKAPESLAAAATEIAHQVEDDHGVPIDLVVTGDRPLDEATVALVRALREALLNAVRHGDPPVSAYVEVGRLRVEAFVRDHGPGFEIDDVPEDRFGVKESIIGRMQRAGGSARIRRLDDGTEVELTLDVEAAAPGEPGSTDRSGEPAAESQSAGPRASTDPDAGATAATATTADAAAETPTVVSAPADPSTDPIKEPTP